MNHLDEAESVHAFRGYVEIASRRVRIARAALPFRKAGCQNLP